MAFAAPQPFEDFAESSDGFLLLYYGYYSTGIVAGKAFIPHGMILCLFLLHDFTFSVKFYDFIHKLRQAYVLSFRFHPYELV